MTVPRDQRAIITAALDLANLYISKEALGIKNNETPHVSDEEVKTIFRDLPFKWPIPGQRVTFEAEPKIIEEFGELHWPDEWIFQLEVCKWLDKIIEGSERSLQIAAEEVSGYLGPMGVRLIPQLQRIGPQFFTMTSNLELSPRLTAETICAIGIAYIFEYRLLHRLRKCQRRGCGLYRLTFEGKPWTYCSLAHQQEGEREKARQRVRKWRRRQR
jgi:hypothetical protein